MFTVRPHFILHLQVAVAEIIPVRWPWILNRGNRLGVRQDFPSTRAWGHSLPYVVNPTAKRARVRTNLNLLQSVMDYCFRTKYLHTYSSISKASKKQVQLLPCLAVPSQSTVQDFGQLARSLFHSIAWFSLVLILHLYSAMQEYWLIPVKNPKQILKLNLLFQLVIMFL